MSQSIYINNDAEDLRAARVRGATDLRSQKFTQFVAGDSLVLDLYLTGIGGALNIQDYAEVRLGIGNLDARPESGSYVVGGSDTLAYNHTATELETVIDSQIAGATVTKLADFVFKVQFDAVGAQTIPSLDFINLQPRSTVSVTRLVTGDATTKESWLWRIFRDPLAFTNTFTDIPNNGIRGNLSLATAGIYDLIANVDQVQTFFEVELTDTSGNVQTSLQARVKLNGEVIGHNFSGSVPSTPSINPAANAFLESFPDPTIKDSLTITADKSPDEDAKLELIDKSTVNTKQGALYKKNGSLYVGTFTDYLKNLRFSSQSGGQVLDFPANSGVRFNNGDLLQKYNEGTFSPKLESGDGTVVQNDYSTRLANYVRIGDLVQINIYITINNFDTAWKTSTKDWRITGLPYTAIGNHNIEIRPIRGWLDLGNNNITGSIGSNNNYLWIEQFIDGGTTAGFGANTSRINGNSFVTHPFNFSTGAFQFTITGSYKTAAN